MFMTAPLVIGNTKAYINSKREMFALQESIWQNLESEKYQYHLAIPASLIDSLVAEKYKAAIFGAQSFDIEGDGAHTGSTTLKQLRDAGAKFTILGHSERRAMGESDDYISDRAREAINNNFTTIVCVGEGDRKNGDEYLDFIKHQLEDSLLGVDRRGADNLIIAYEPLWAIGAVRPATAEQTLEVVIHIRRSLVELFGLENAKKIKVIYGGAVTSDGVAEFVREAGVDGVLVGRASTRGKDFAAIVNELNRS
jgi:triosephosphate isomerase